VYVLSIAVDTVKGAICGAVTVGHVVAVVAEYFARVEPGLFANNAVSLDHLLMSIGLSENPAPAFQCDRSVREVGDCDEVDKGVWRVDGETLGIMKIYQAVKLGP